MRVLIICCSMLAACGGSPPSSPSSSTSTPLRLTGSISQAVLQQGDIATLAFRLENAGSSDVNVQFPSACQVTLYIATASGTVIYPASGRWVCAQVLTSLTLAPGGSKVEEMRVRGGLSEMSSVYGLPIGSYTAYARIDGSAVLQSPPVAFTVK